MRNVLFANKSLEELDGWVLQDRRIARKILKLILVARKEPFTGLGKPEALKHNMKGYWSRRITDEHRLIYQVTEEEIIILSCLGHYS